MWLEAKISKNLIGKPRAIGDRFECPLNAAVALLASGKCRQVSGPHPLPDRDAVVNPEPEPEVAPSRPVPKYADELKRNDHGEMGAALKAAGFDVPRSKADRHAALTALQES